jgi:hypothetical protein
MVLTDPLLLATLVRSSPMCWATALDLARGGQPVIPCHVATRQGCTCARPDCPAPGAHALITLDRASADRETVRGWWTTWSGAGVGIVVDGRLQAVLIDSSAFSQATVLPADGDPLRVRRCLEVA